MKKLADISAFDQLATGTYSINNTSYAPTKRVKNSLANLLGATIGMAATHPKTLLALGAGGYGWNRWQNRKIQKEYEDYIAALNKTNPKAARIFDHLTEAVDGLTPDELEQHAEALYPVIGNMYRHGVRIPPAILRNYILSHDVDHKLIKHPRWQLAYENLIAPYWRYPKRYAKHHAVNFPAEWGNKALDAYEEMEKALGAGQSDQGKAFGQEGDKWFGMHVLHGGDPERVRFKQVGKNEWSPGLISPESLPQFLWRCVKNWYTNTVNS